MSVVPSVCMHCRPPCLHVYCCHGCCSFSLPVRLIVVQCSPFYANYTFTLLFIVSQFWLYLYIPFQFLLIIVIQSYTPYPAVGCQWKRTTYNSETLHPRHFTVPRVVFNLYLPCLTEELPARWTFHFFTVSQAWYLDMTNVHPDFFRQLRQKAVHDKRIVHVNWVSKIFRLEKPGKIHKCYRVIGLLFALLQFLKCCTPTTICHMGP